MQRTRLGRCPGIWVVFYFYGDIGVCALPASFQVTILSIFLEILSSLLDQLCDRHACQALQKPLKQPFCISMPFLTTLPTVVTAVPPDLERCLLLRTSIHGSGVLYSRITSNLLQDIHIQNLDLPVCQPIINASRLAAIESMSGDMVRMILDGTDQRDIGGLGIFQLIDDEFDGSLYSSLHQLIGRWSPCGPHRGPASKSP